MNTKNFFLVKNKTNGLYLRVPGPKRYSSLWTDKPQSTKAYNTIGPAKLAVTNAVQAHKVKRSDMVIEEFESTLVKIHEV